ncbi:23 kDa jasmonate-induced protein-like [Durio zibethinus]|uniref:23 kDa jasmonate-induced protein-like n=1 Tax=Durio zibethinus TaxID=66656 RepID=A0A6P5YVV3_DURZI|nr:23 kDa jasmonate-induced protein-like [Durio zibethinus]
MAQNATTNGRVKNITSSPIAYQISKDWQGAVGSGNLNSYPVQIQASVTGTFQHVGNENGSQGAAVYRVTISSAKAYDVLIAWFNPPNSPNKAYTLIDQAGSFTPDRWPGVFNTLINSSQKSTSTLGGCTSEVEIGDENFPTFSATISTA